MITANDKLHTTDDARPHDVNTNDNDAQTKDSELDHNDVVESITRRSLPKYKGVYVEGQVLDLDVLMTVDTGASSTILSKRIYDKLDNRRPKLRLDSLKTLSSADGRTINYCGHAKFELQLGRLQIVRDLMIANIEDEMLLGADILQNDDLGQKN